MRLNFLFLLSIVLSGFSGPGDVYDFKIDTIDSGIRQLKEFSGKRILIIELPVKATDRNTALLQRLDTLGKLYPDQLAIIGVLSYEDGYADSLLPYLQTWYRSILGKQTLISKGIYTHKNSIDQHPLFSWLTHAEQNGHFDDDVAGTGQKYFIDTKGQLFGLVDPESGLNKKLTKILMR